jgi:plastocyanin
MRLISKENRMPIVGKIMRWSWLAAIGVTAVLVVAAACGGGDDDGPSGDGNPNGSISAQPDVPQAVGDEVTEAVDGVIETEMIDNSYTFNNFKVGLGETVTIRATNTGLAIHNLRVAGADGEWSTDDDAASEPPLANPGETVEVVFTPTAAGTYTFRCDFHPLEQGGVVVVA